MSVPDIAAIGTRVVLIPWQDSSSMAANGHFAEPLHKAGVPPDHRVYFICRSGTRSLAAAFNVADGFEGSVDHEGRRGILAGWNAAGLPCMQR
ncbi:MAG: hypothetical protein WCP77_03850 [Roseococcus sp.]